MDPFKMNCPNTTVSLQSLIFILRLLTALEVVFYPTSQPSDDTVQGLVLVIQQSVIMKHQDVKIWFICDRPSLKLASACDISTHICPYLKNALEHMLLFVSVSLCNKTVPSRLRKDIHLHFSTSSPCISLGSRTEVLLSVVCFLLQVLTSQAMVRAWIFFLLILLTAHPLLSH